MFEITPFDDVESPHHVAVELLPPTSAPIPAERLHGTPLNPKVVVETPLNVVVPVAVK